jgi:thioredoxin reductase (NADPH)
VEVSDVKLNNEFHEVVSTAGTFTTKVVILAMGTYHRHLSVPGEEEFDGKGVSYCATCDGALYKGKKAVVVGGGNSAVTEALYLDQLLNIGIGQKNVYLIHRRDRLRAEESLQDQIINHSNVNIVWDSIVTQIKGSEMKGVRNVVLKNVKTGEESSLRVVVLTEDGLIKVDESQRTNIQRIYACGDITPGQGQISVAVGEGTTAAISAFLDMRGGDWYGEVSSSG